MVVRQQHAIDATDAVFGEIALPLRDVDEQRRADASLPNAGLDLRITVESFENDLIRQALDRTGWNKNQAARLLGLNRTTLVEMIKRKRLAGKVA